MRGDQPRMATMNLKTYRGNTMAQALAEVKKDLGKDAVILHTRVHRQGGVLGVGGAQVVEITASDRPPAAQVRVRAAQPAAAPVAFKAAEFAPHPLEKLRTPGPSEVASPARSLPSTAVELAPVDERAAATLQAELASIRRLVGQVLQISRAGARPAAVPVLASGGMPDPLFDLYSRLVSAGVNPDRADAILAGARDDLSSSELLDPAIAQHAVLRRLAGLIPSAGPMTPGTRQPDGRPLTIALAGPTGVGKTTTIAKLAAAYKLRQGRRVGLVTCDTYRIAAVEQLRVYANIIGLPLKVALTPEELADACSAMADLDVVMIDTAGRGQRDSARLEELAAIIGSAKPHETHLVLSAGASEPVLEAAGRRFAALKPDRLIYSKLDEAVHYGPVVNLLKALGLRLSYVTTGQEVPDHIELANPDRLAKLVLDGPAAKGWGE
jgi:flagellar biosynthesis protein FlhF